MGKYEYSLNKAITQFGVVAFIEKKNSSRKKNK